MSYAEARRLYELAVTRGESERAPRGLQAIDAAIQQVHAPSSASASAWSSVA